MDVTTFTIPMEVMTAVNLLIFNIPFGVGADFAFGTSKMNIGMSSGITISGDNTIKTTSDGNLTIDAGGKASPNFANLKLMTGLGLSIGPVIAVDIPITWYFVDNGFNIGLSVGVAF
jgi:hypothetical protein